MGLAGRSERVSSNLKEREVKMIGLTFARLISLARWARAAGRSSSERREMLTWVLRASSKI